LLLKLNTNNVSTRLTLPDETGFHALPEDLLSTLNTEEEGTGLVNDLDTLLTKRNQSAGRKRKVEQAIIDAEENTNNMNKFAKMTSFKSGKLCAANIFCISDEDMKDRLGEVEGEMNEKKSQKAVRMQTSADKQNKKFKQGATKFFQGKNLLCEDLRALLKEISTKHDSPLMKKVDDLRSQFHR
jgi:hypothetical protein